MATLSGDTLIWLILGLVALAIAGWLLLLGRATPAEPLPEAEAPPAGAPPVAEPVAITGNLNAIGVPAALGAPDDLLLIKGLGPRLNTLLASLEVTRFDQIAGWGAAEIATVDAHLGNFKGRIARDNWVEQAGLLATGSIAAFEAKFGKLDSENK